MSRSTAFLIGLDTALVILIAADLYMRYFA